MLPELRMCKRIVRCHTKNSSDVSPSPSNNRPDYLLSCHPVNDPGHHPADYRNKHGPDDSFHLLVLLYTLMPLSPLHRSNQVIAVLASHQGRPCGILLRTDGKRSPCRRCDPVMPIRAQNDHRLNPQKNCEIKSYEKITGAGSRRTWCR